MAIEIKKAERERFDSFLKAVHELRFVEDVRTISVPVEMIVFLKYFLQVGNVEKYNTFYYAMEDKVFFCGVEILEEEK